MVSPEYHIARQEQFLNGWSHFETTSPERDRDHPRSNPVLHTVGKL